MVITYNDVDDRFNTSMEWNEDNPPHILSKQGDEYTFFIISDSHLGGTKNITTMYNAATIESADGVLMIGDLCSGHEEDYDTLNSVINRFAHIPSFQVIGNHDLYFEGWEHYYHYFATSTYTITVNTPNAKDLFIMLDSGGGTLGKMQLEWFEDILKKNREDYRHCIVFTHNNVLLSRHTISTLPMNEEVKALLDLFLIHQVDYCITGHDHKYDEFTFGNTKYIVTDALLDTYKNAAYLKLNNINGTISVSHHPVSE